MPVMLWCWRCRFEVPMLDEAEWQRVFAVVPEEGFDPRSHVPRNLAFAGRVWLERYNAITMAAKKPAKAQATVTLRNLAAELAESHEVPKRQAEAMLSDMVGLIAKHLKKGGPGHPASPASRRPHGTQPGDRRGHQDQGQQEGRVPRCQGSQGSGLTPLPFPRTWPKGAPYIMATNHFPTLGPASSHHSRRAALLALAQMRPLLRRS
jgi:hypothetical protein